MKNRPTELALQIKEAFPKAFQGPQMSHQECVGLRARLIAVDAEGFEAALAQILLDLLNSHTGQAGGSENAEEVIRFLDVAENSECLKSLPGHNPEERATTDSLLRNAKIESLADIDAKQADVLVAWLEAAREWPDLSWYRDEVSSAIGYWRGRCRS